MPSAGDVERFAYCAHNWWLAKRGVEGGSGEGIEKHDALGQAQEQVERMNEEARRAMSWSFRVLLAAASATILTFEVIYLRAHPQHLVFLALSLVLVGASSGLLAIGLQGQRRVRREQAAKGLIPAELQDTDLYGEGRLLVDEKLDLHGRPDYVLTTSTGVVPVEVKSSSTPPKPYASHELQLACYIHLLREEGKTVPYGLINYPGGVFRVEASKALQARLEETLTRIDRAKRLGVANRDHTHAARCHGCARRDACGQSL